MDGGGRSKIKKYAVTALLGLAAAAVAAYVSGLAGAETAADAASAICDGLFTAAVLLLGGGGLVYASNEGAFDMLRYGTSLALRIMTPGKFQKKYDSYAEYAKYRREKRSEWLHIVIVGGAYLLLAIVALGVYYGLK